MSKVKRLFSAARIWDVFRCLSVLFSAVNSEKYTGVVVASLLLPFSYARLPLADCFFISKLIASFVMLMTGEIERGERTKEQGKKCPFWPC